MAQRFRADAQLLTHSNNSVTTAPSTITIPSQTSFICVNNTDGTNNLLVSFDGTNYFTLLPGQSISVEGDNIGARNSLKLKSSAGTIASECLFGSEA